MKQSVNQVVDFFKNHKYGKLSLTLLVLGLVIVSAMLFSSLTEEKPIALSKVAAAISAGQVVSIEDSSTIKMGRKTQHGETKPLPFWNKCSFLA